MLKLKEYMFNFEGGGWNRVMAKTRRGAITLARNKYKDSEHTILIEESVRLCTKEDYDAHMARFY